MLPKANHCIAELVERCFTLQDPLSYWLVSSSYKLEPGPNIKVKEWGIVKLQVNQSKSVDKMANNIYIRKWKNSIGNC